MPKPMDDADLSPRSLIARMRGDARLDARRRAELDPVDASPLPEEWCDASATVARNGGSDNARPMVRIHEWCEAPSQGLSHDLWQRVLRFLIESGGDRVQGFALRTVCRHFAYSVAPHGRTNTTGHRMFVCAIPPPIRSPLPPHRQRRWIVCYRRGAAPAVRVDEDGRLMVLHTESRPDLPPDCLFERRRWTEERTMGSAA